MPSFGWPVVLPDYAARLYEAAGYKVEGDTVVYFRCCPARIVTRFTREMQRWFFWVEWTGLVPPNVFSDDLDPRWHAAMERLKLERCRVDREEIEAMNPKNEAAS